MRKSAKETHEQHLAKIQAEVARIQQWLSKEKTGPKDWADVGDAARISYELTQITDMMHGTGEYAE